MYELTLIETNTGTTYTQMCDDLEEALLFIEDLIAAGEDDE